MMANFLDSLKSILGYSDEGRNDPFVSHVASTDFFQQLDIEQMRQRLGLEEEEAQRRNGNSLSTNGHFFDDIEQRIISAIEREKQAAYKTLAQHLSTYRDRLVSINFQAQFTEGLMAAESAFSDFKWKVSIGRDLLFDLRRDVILITDEINRFKKRHLLERIAQYPASMTLVVGVILVLLTAEGVLNGTFLALGHIHGLVGGIGEALVIAMLNIGTGLVTGWKVLPFLTHRRISLKVVSILGCLLYVVWTLGFNLAVAHYRHVLGLVGTGAAQPEQAARLALESLLAHTFDIPDIQAWLLFALGCLFSCIAVGDGWKMDDPYPGYGRRERRRVALQSDYIAQKENLIEELTNTRDAALTKMTSASNEVARRRSEYHAILSSRKRLEEEFRQHLDHLEQTANSLLNTYWRARQLRSSEPLFKSWKMSRPASPDSGSEGYIDDHDLEKEVGRFSENLDEKRQELKAEFEAATASYERIEDLKLEDIENGQFSSQPS